MYIDSLVHIYIHIHKSKAHSLERESQKTESGTKLAYCLYRNRKQVIANIKACGYWNMSFEKELLTMKKRQH